MTTPDILYKLGKELDAGIETEPQVVYLLAGIRKIIERDDVQDKYPDLKFHCDWVLHPKLEGMGAKRVLREFDAAHPYLKANMDIRDLPDGLGKKITRPDGWAHFLHLYTKVIEDIPLQVALTTPKKKKGPRPPMIPSPRHISGVTVHFREAARPLAESDGEVEVLYEVRWTIHDNKGKSGSVFVLNSYTRAT